jgi:predicted metal-dependent phosphoesterase TrpH
LNITAFHSIRKTLWDYEIFPKVIETHRKTKITIGPHNGRPFSKGVSYTILIAAMNEGLYTAEGDANAPYPRYSVCPDEDGRLSFSHTFESEGLCSVIVTANEELAETWGAPELWDRFPGWKGKDVVNFFDKGYRPGALDFWVYALDKDLYCLRPYKGDFHVHTCNSDGNTPPALTAAYFRRAGFDFMALTDHFIYESAGEARDAYRQVPIDIHLVSGEEVHPPKNFNHFVNFGGTSSVNTLMRDERERYDRELQQLVKEFEAGAGSSNNEFSSLEYASAQWVCREIQKTGGLAILAHPYGVLGKAFMTREKLLKAILKNVPFDALELLNNGWAMPLGISMWQQLRSEGLDIKIVGDSDTHYAEEVSFDVFNSVVLAEECNTPALMRAVREGRAVAWEQLKSENLFDPLRGEPNSRIYGDHRYTSFVHFLLREYFPLHDELCFEEGRAMRDYVLGNKNAKALLELLHGRCAALMDRCWGVS